MSRLKWSSLQFKKQMNYLRRIQSFFYHWSNLWELGFDVQGDGDAQQSTFASNASKHRKQVKQGMHDPIGTLHGHKPQLLLVDRGNLQQHRRCARPLLEHDTYSDPILTFSSNPNNLERADTDACIFVAGSDYCSLLGAISPNISKLTALVNLTLSTFCS